MGFGDGQAAAFGSAHWGGRMRQDDRKRVVNPGRVPLVHLVGEDLEGFVMPSRVDGGIVGEASQETRDKKQTMPLATV